ncbi:hypothetical protein [Moorena producens]|uniref:hypothetical protein n=1 Tax=Moorena producens TaxID=1155739 RepID=UPI003C733D3A
MQRRQRGNPFGGAASRQRPTDTPLFRYVSKYTIITEAFSRLPTPDSRLPTPDPTLTNPPL